MYLHFNYYLNIMFSWTNFESSIEAIVYCFGSLLLLWHCNTSKWVVQKVWWILCGGRHEILQRCLMVPKPFMLPAWVDRRFPTGNALCLVIHSLPLSPLTWCYFTSSILVLTLVFSRSTRRYLSQSFYMILPYMMGVHTIVCTYLEVFNF